MDRQRYAQLRSARATQRAGTDWIRRGIRRPMVCNRTGNPQPPRGRRTWGARRGRVVGEDVDGHRETAANPPGALIGEVKNALDSPSPAYFLGGKAADAAVTLPTLLFGGEGAGFGQSLPAELPQSTMAQPICRCTDRLRPTSHHRWVGRLAGRTFTLLSLMANRPRISSRQPLKCRLTTSVTIRPSGAREVRWPSRLMRCQRQRRHLLRHR